MLPRAWRATQPPHRYRWTRRAPAASCNGPQQAPMVRRVSVARPARSRQNRGTETPGPPMPTDPTDAIHPQLHASWQSPVPPAGYPELVYCDAGSQSWLDFTNAAGGFASDVAAVNVPWPWKEGFEPA